MRMALGASSALPCFLLALLLATNAASVAAVSSPTACGATHAVVSWDSCYAISSTAKLSLADFLAINPGLDCNTLQPGQVVCTGAVNLDIPASPACNQTYSVVAGDTCSAISQAHDNADLYTLNPGINCNNLQIGQQLCIRPASPCNFTHWVVAGDTCYDISVALGLGDYHELYPLNPGLNCDNLAIGQPLCVPALQPPMPPSSSPPPCDQKALIAPYETCYSISISHGASNTSRLMALNPGLDCKNLTIGSDICIWPSACSAAHKVAANDGCDAISAAANITTTQLQALNPYMLCNYLQLGQVLCLAAGPPPPPSPPISPPPSTPMSSSSQSSSNAIAIGVGAGVGAAVLLLAAGAAFAFWMWRRGDGAADLSSAKGGMQMDAAIQAEGKGQGKGQGFVVLDLAPKQAPLPSIFDGFASPSLATTNSLATSNSAMTMQASSCYSRSLDTLEFIRWEELGGPQGAASALAFLCQGGQGLIYLGTWQDEVVVVKKMDQFGHDMRRAQQELSREAYIMSSCRHPNIAQIYGLSKEPATGVPALVMRYYSHGSLRDLLAESPGLSLDLRLRMARDIAWGMQYLHSRHNEMIVHGDLKTTNLLIDENLRVKISDFGLSSIKSASRTISPMSAARSVVFSAPEILQNAALLFSSNRSVEGDIYAYAMVLFELFTGVCPFNGASDGQVVGLVCNGVRPTVPLMDVCDPQSKVISPFAARGVPLPIVHLMQRCWDQDPCQRPPFDQVLVSLEAAAAALQLDIE